MASTKKKVKFIFPLKKQKELVLSKLPRDFREDFKTYCDFRKEANSITELYKQLKEVGSEYSGSWEDSTYPTLKPLAAFDYFQILRQAT